MTEFQKTEREKNRNCTANCKNYHPPTIYKGNWKSPLLFKDYVKTININHFYGYFDIFVVLNYLKCLDEMMGEDSSFEDELSETALENAMFKDNANSHLCEWIEEDDDGNEIECNMCKIPNSDFCDKHNEDDKVYKQMIEYYVKSVLGTIDITLIKQLNKQISGWKTELENDLNLSKYMLTKTIKEQSKNGKNETEIIDYLYNLGDD